MKSMRAASRPEQELAADLEGVEEGSRTWDVAAEVEVAGAVRLCPQAVTRGLSYVG